MKDVHDPSRVHLPTCALYPIAYMYMYILCLLDWVGCASLGGGTGAVPPPPPPPKRTVEDDFHAFTHTYTYISSWVAYRMVSVGVVRCWSWSLTMLMPCVTELSSTSVSRCTRKPSRTTRRQRMWRTIHKRYACDKSGSCVSFWPRVCNVEFSIKGL